MTRRSLLFVVFFALAVASLSTRVGATAGSKSDSTSDATGGSGAVKVDLASVSHSDDGTAISYTAHTVSTVVPGDIVRIQWHLDMNNNHTFDETSGDACIQVAPGGPTGLIATLKATCSGQSQLGTADVTTTPAGGGDDLKFAFDNGQFRTATSFTGTTYNYFVKSVDANGYADFVPDTTANPAYITHSSVALAGATSAPTTPPATTPPTTTAPATTAPATTAPATSATPTPTSSVEGTSASADPTASPTTGTLPRTGANIVSLVVIAAALLYAGIELLGAKQRMDDQSRDE